MSLQGNNISLNWIPAHVGHPGNERADTLAKRGTKKRLIRERTLPLPVCAIKEEIYRWEKEAHRKTWRQKEFVNGKTFCRQTRMFLPEPNPKLWKKVRKHSTRNIKILTQLITGHCTLNRHLEVMKIIDDSECQNCGYDDETAEHFLCHCDAFCFPRQHIFGSMYLSKDDLPNLNPDDIIKFVKESGRFEQ